jgi:hypothetical protein
MTKLYLNNDEDVNFKASEEVYTDENGAKYGVDTDEHDKTYENESTRDTSPMVRISLKEYDALRDQTKYITDPTLIGAIDKIEFFVKELRKHIIRKY